MQRAVRSIVPKSQEVGLDENKTETTTNEQSEQHRRRRSGRRVVRVAGAANAKLPVHVEEEDAQVHDSQRDTANRRSKRAAVRVPKKTAHDEPRNVEPKNMGESATDSGSEHVADQPSRRTRTRKTVKRSVGFDALEFEAPKIHEHHATQAHTDDDKARGNANGKVHRVSDADDGERKTRAQQAVESLASTTTRKGVNAARPMTSLLFQEPVIPVEHAHNHAWNTDDEADDASDASPAQTRRESRNKRQRNKTEQRSHTISAVDRDEESDNEPRNRTRRSRRAEDEQHDTQHEARAKRNQRLNAQERRAAAEVEQIEEDLEYDDIHYVPIDDDDFKPSTSIRRRRNRGSHKDSDGRRDISTDDTDEVTSNVSIEDDDRAESASRNDNRDESRNRDEDYADEDRDEEQLSGVRRRRRRSRESESDDDDSTYETMGTRRRRRRRSGKNADSSSTQDNTSSSKRSRKQQYIDEITDIQGSTRLEAKRQRRRDNRRDRSRQMQLVEQDFLARREHVKREMVVREKEQHTQISVIEDDILVEHYVSDIQEVATVGNIYLGRVQNVLPSMEAAFVDIGQARNGVLYAGEVNWDTTRLEGQPRRIELAFRSGDPVLVQVTKDPIGHKGARLTSQVTLAGRFLVLVPSGGMTGVSRKLTERERTRLKSIVAKIAPKDMGVIIRTAADNASEEAITKDLENLTRQWESIEDKRKNAGNLKKPKLLQGEPDVAIRVVRDIFNDEFQSLIVQGDKVYERIEEYLDSMAPDLKDRLIKWEPAEHEGSDVFDTWQIDGQLRKGMERQVYLPSGGSLVIDRTEAMTTIDVNTGRYIGKGKSLEETVTRCNLEAAEEIARQLRLRDIGGMVMIDYVDMVMPANRDLVLKRLLECLARDRTKHQVAEVTSLGLVQMTRKRVGQGLVEAFSEECPTCKGRGFILHDEPTISASSDDPYAMKGGDPFVKTKHNHHETPEQGDSGVSSPDVKAKLAKIAAAAQAASKEPHVVEE